MVNVKNVYSVAVNYEDFKSFIPVEMSLPIRCKGRPMYWKTALEIAVDEEDLGIPEADISLLNIGSFVISENLYHELFKRFDDSCEFLPLVMGSRRFRLVNVINIVDCLDKEHSEFNEFGGISKPVFDEKRLPAGGFFKLSEDNFSSIFCVDDVRELIEHHQLTGVELESFPVY